MAKDYDEPRTNDDLVDAAADPSIQSLTAQRPESATNLGDETDHAGGQFDEPDTDLTGEETAVPLVPRQDDEFTCTVCYLVHHRSQMSKTRRTVCDECAA